MTYANLSDTDLLALRAQLMVTAPHSDRLREVVEEVDRRRKPVKEYPNLNTYTQAVVELEDDMGWKYN